MPRPLKKFNASADLDAERVEGRFSLLIGNEDQVAKYWGEPQDALDLAIWLFEFVQETKPGWFTEETDAV